MRGRRLIIVVSDRVPRAAVRELFEKTGWEDIRSFVTPEPVRQASSVRIAILQCCPGLSVVTASFAPQESEAPIDLP